MKPVLFIDFDGTLCFDKYWRGLDAHTFERVQHFVFSQHEPLVLDWMRGEHTAEEINLFVSKQLNIPYRKLWNVYVSDSKTQQVNSKTLERIKKLSRRFQTILITDNMDSFSRFTAPALKLERYFNVVANSFEYKLLKNDQGGAWFKQLAQKSNAQIDKSIVIDNSPHTCDTFSKLNGTACLVTAEHPVEHWLTVLEQ